MDTNQFQSHVLKELSDIKNLFIKNEQDHADLGLKIETIRTEMEKFKSDIRKDLNSHLRWNIGIIISMGLLIIGIFKLFP
ncbi:MAG: hypothetical protein OXM61_17030 [Candidatus Poribacteria bacterium]|nr:hypothetical protein [Candidatus Poribacteria bacterium]